jgi:PKD repeat protein
MKFILAVAFEVVVLTGISQNQMHKGRDLAAFFGDRPEVYFTFQTCDEGVIDKLTHIISIDKIDGCTITANASKKEFAIFLDYDLPFELLPHTSTSPDDIRVLDVENIRNITNWNFYPTYEAYVGIMNQFETDHPALCEVFSIDTSVQGRKLMMAKISAPFSRTDARPQFLYTGTMHGDELVGFNLLLRLIDYLLNNYGTDPQVTYLLDNVEIWINPNANPDGTYYGGNHTVWNSIRRNANSVDLNRNYPDPRAGPHPDGNPWQPETIAFMQLAEDNNFVMSANTHGGAEVINYPWDTWQHLTADNDWWVFVSRQYADTVHTYAPSGYMSGFDNGITNGYAWYSITGGRQDYMNYFQHCREVTMELSNTKKVPTSQLESHWQWNYRSLLNYIEQCTYGISGTVTDLETNLPVVAKLSIAGHDLDNSHVYSESQHGFYQRLLDTGNYDLTFSAPGYQPVNIPDVSVTRYNTVELNIEMDAGALAPHFSVSSNFIPVGGKVDFTDESYGLPVSWHWEFDGGNPAVSGNQHPAEITYNDAGHFNVKLTIANSNGDTATMMKSGYIKVLPVIEMNNETVTTCSALFYDSGGESANYSNNENLVMTFLPETLDATLKVEFTEFSIESHSSCNYDWLKIYDGNSTSANLIGTFCGTNSPGTIIASNPDGALTFWFNSDYSVTYPGWKAIITCYKEHDIALKGGWSGISSYVTPENPNIEAVTSAIHNQLIIIQNENGFYQPQQNINTLAAWDAYDGYVIKMDEAAQLAIQGAPLQNNTILLQPGWNILPVLTDYPVNVADIASALGNNLILIKEVAGYTTCWPEFAIYDLSLLNPGSAYFIKVQHETVFTFPQP